MTTTELKPKSKRRPRGTSCQICGAPRNWGRKYDQFCPVCGRKYRDWHVDHFEMSTVQTEIERYQRINALRYYRSLWTGAKLRQAKKDHPCNSVGCSNTIQAGELYLDTGEAVAASESRFVSRRFCWTCLMKGSIYA